MQQINENRLQAQIHAITKKIVKGKVKNEKAAKIKVYNLNQQLNSIKQFNFLSR